jgi:four helix bundle protein
VPVWQVSADLAAKIFTWTQQPAFRCKVDLANQLQRAAMSISNNVAEGFERGTTNELLNYLYIARGSAGEVRSMLAVMERMVGFADLQSEISVFKSTCESISRQIRGWANSLQNSDIKGQRHLYDRSRASYDLTKRRETAEQNRRQWQAEFEAKLRHEAAIRNRDDELTE